MIKQGKITSWNDDKGYGFITPSSGEDKIFAHIKAFKNQVHRPEVNRLVTYILTTDKQGRICAAEVTMLAAAVIKKDDQGNWVLANAYAALFLAFIMFICLVGTAPSWLFAGYLTTSLITYIVYYFDKSAAQKGQWRTQESTLHLLALFGGWPGALAAQQLLRHKSRKKPFRMVFWMTVVLNSCASIVFINPSAVEALKSLLKK
ncbi:DUF1294 domain-containing protein [Geomonas paludis]|uniref:DNA-binding protein n=1 Tax=Geomonas paludis TaxID=2740185 RepID=A0A6V8MX92_9BACT|nr:DUF1294 domain-containing protein [Geomonas paludis]UPU34305.1 DUF1294 domain-containing protein [Geomonas paludis]GFO64287.1 DNA-binding protein [Geomonas paludis]